jgi:hypothetical protein
MSELYGYRAVAIRPPVLTGSVRISFLFVGSQFGARGLAQALRAFPLRLRFIGDNPNAAEPGQQMRR